MIYSYGIKLQDNLIYTYLPDRFPEIISVVRKTLIIVSFIYKYKYNSIPTIQHRLISIVLGAFLWVTIAYMNINVMKAMCMKEEYNQSNNVTCVGNAMASVRKEERAYAWLMLSLCFTFVVPWALQMVITNYLLLLNKDL